MRVTSAGSYLVAVDDVEVPVVGGGAPEEGGGGAGLAA